MAKRIKPKAPPPFQTREEFEKAVDEIARLDIEVKKQEAELKKRHQELDDKFAPAIQAMSKSIQDLMARAEPYFAANASKLCKPGQREGETPLARFGVRLGMPTVVKTISAAWKKLGEMFFGDGRPRLTRRRYLQHGATPKAATRTWPSPRSRRKTHFGAMAST